MEDGYHGTNDMLIYVFTCWHIWTTYTTSLSTSSSSALHDCCKRAGLVGSFCTASRDAQICYLIYVCGMFQKSLGNRSHRGPGATLRQQTSDVSDIFPNGWNVRFSQMPDRCSSSALGLRSVIKPFCWTRTYNPPSIFDWVTLNVYFASYILFRDPLTFILESIKIALPQFGWGRFLCDWLIGWLIDGYPF